MTRDKLTKFKARVPAAGSDARGKRSHEKWPRPSLPGAQRDSQSPRMWQPRPISQLPTSTCCFIGRRGSRSLRVQLIPPPRRRRQPEHGSWNMNWARARASTPPARRYICKSSPGPLRKHRSNRQRTRGEFIEQLIAPGFLSRPGNGIRAIKFLHAPLKPKEKIIAKSCCASIREYWSRQLRIWNKFAGFTIAYGN